MRLASYFAVATRRLLSRILLNSRFLNNALLASQSAFQTTLPKAIDTTPPWFAKRTGKCRQTSRSRKQKTRPRNQKMGIFTV